MIGADLVAELEPDFFASSIPGELEANAGSSNPNLTLTGSR